MIRFVFGILVGGVLSALVLAGVSYMAPVEDAAAPPPVPVEQPDAGGTPPPVTAPATAPDAAGTTPSATAPAEPVPDAPAGAVTPATPAPADGTIAPKSETTPKGPSGTTVTPAGDATAPDAGTADSAMVPAATGADREDAGTSAKADAMPRTAGTAGEASMIPPDTEMPDVKTALAPLDLAPPADTLLAPAADEVARAADAPGALTAIDPEDLPALPTLPAAPPKIETGPAPAPAAPPTVDPVPEVLAQLDPAPPLPGSQKTLPQIGDDALPPAMDAPLPPAEPEPRILTEDPPLDDATGATLTPAPRLGGAVEGVVTGRLPRIGTATPAETGVPQAAEGTPLTRYARIFENPQGKPVFSIVLIDTGAADLDRKALAELPFPVSFALDPLDPAAASNAAIYRAAGQEVLMLATGIPEGATASDLEVSFAALAEKIPEAIAVLDQPEPVFQDDRPLATQVVPILAAQGRGMVTWDAGLNAADQVARREGLPSAMAFRYLDGEGENTETIRRYLDRAAFRAAQDGRVVVIGQTRPETVEALIAWGLEGRSASVALAPISAALSVN